LLKDPAVSKAPPQLGRKVEQADMRSALMLDTSLAERASHTAAASAAESELGQQNIGLSICEGNRRLSAYVHGVASGIPAHFLAAPCNNFLGALSRNKLRKTISLRMSPVFSQPTC